MLRLGCPVCRTCNRYDPTIVYLSHWTEISAWESVQARLKEKNICQLIGELIKIVPSCRQIAYRATEFYAFFILE